MVIPVPNGLGQGANMTGPFPEHMVGQFKKLKVTVWLLIIAMVTKTIGLTIIAGISKGFFAGLNLAISVALGIFLLRDDPTLGKVHKCLVDTLCKACDENCGSQLRCLMPYTIYNLVTLFMDLLMQGIGFQMLSYCITGGVLPTGDGQTIVWPSIFDLQGLIAQPLTWLARMMFVISIPSSLLGEIGASYFGWKAMKQLRDEGEPAAPGGMPGLGGGYQPLASQPRQPQPPFNAGRSNSQAPPQQHTFQAFQGAGQRLGSG
jgi:hypothetical protein